MHDSLVSCCWHVLLVWSQSSVKGCTYHALQLGVLAPRVFGSSFGQHTMVLAHYRCKAAVIARACIKGPPWRAQPTLHNSLTSTPRASL